MIQAGTARLNYGANDSPAIEPAVRCIEPAEKAEVGNADGIEMVFQNKLLHFVGHE